MEYIKDLDSTVEKTMSPFKKTAYLKAILHLVLVLYAARLAPSLPVEVLSLFENQYFKLFIFSIILWTAQFSPSTSILIAISFMVSMNAVNKKPLWEFLENIAFEEQKKEESNVVPITPSQSMEAVNVLAQAASSSEAIPANTIANITNIAAANVTTQEGVNALKQLAQQAVTPGPVPQQMVAEAVDQIAASISAPSQSQEFAPAPTPYEAVNALANAAASPSAASPESVTAITNMVVPSITTEQGAIALQQLAQQAVVPEAGVPEKVSQAVQEIVSSIPSPTAFAPAAFASAPTPIQAISVLANAASSPEASSPQAIAAITNMVAPSVTTEQGAVALQQLAQQAIVPEAGATEMVAQAVQEVVSSMPTPIVGPKVEDSIEAVKLLAQAAASPEASSAQAVSNVVNIAAANIDSPEAENALKILAQEAVTPGSASPEVIVKAVKEVVADMPAAEPPVIGAPIASIAQKVSVSEPAPAEGCFPIRRYDMGKVEYSTVASKSSNPVFEDYAPWVKK